MQTDARLNPETFARRLGGVADPFAHLDMVPVASAIVIAANNATKTDAVIDPELEKHEPIDRAQILRAMVIIESQAKLFRPDFGRWLKSNWHIYKRFDEEAQRVWDSGRRSYSARTLIEYIRHDTFVREVSASPMQAYKVNNSYVPDLGRIYGLMNDGREDFFECRVMRHTTIRTSIRGGPEDGLIAATGA